MILAVGATLDASAADLVAFAVMGSAYARIISKNQNPSVALLSNGTEPQKGPARVVEANAKLLKMAGVHFIGNVEGVDIPKGTADVIVCDGFVGNVCLKMLEGVSETVVALKAGSTPTKRSCSGAPAWRCSRAASSASKK